MARQSKVSYGLNTFSILWPLNKDAKIEEALAQNNDIRSNWKNTDQMNGIISDMEGNKKVSSDQSEESQILQEEAS